MDVSTSAASSVGGITVVVPTYRRPGPLGWALASILRQRFPGNPPAHRRLVILNNDSSTDPVIKVVERVVDRIGENGWEVKLHHRNPPIHAVNNMYNGIAEFADEGDVVFLNGDDDLMLPDSLALRAEMFRCEPNMDILLARGMSALLFTAGNSEQNTRAFFMEKGTEPAVRQGVRLMRMEDLCRIGYILISCHAYRNGARFRGISAETRALLLRLPCGGDDRLSMMPQFLPILGVRQGGVFATETRACLRGQFAHDVLNHRSGSGYWGISALYLLTQTELQQEPDLDLMREEYLAISLRCVCFSLGQPDFRQLARLTQLARAAFSLTGAKAVLWSLFQWLRRQAKLNALRVRWRLRFDLGKGWDEVFANY